MPSLPEEQVEKLRLAINNHCETNKAIYLTNCVTATDLLLRWIGYLRISISRNVADRLLDAAQATCIEVAGCLSVGLVRPAIFSIRSQLELLLAWIYFNDHPIEWRHVQSYLDDFPMRAVNLKYMRSYNPRFFERFTMLVKYKTRKNDDPYGLLSIHVHSTSPSAAPTIGELQTLVQNTTRCNECVELQKDVSEYLTDVFAAWYADRWHDFPTEITAKLKSRLTPNALKEFCAD